jgi:hypothetical protein
MGGEIFATGQDGAVRDRAGHIPVIGQVAQRRPRLRSGNEGARMADKVRNYDVREN